MDKFEKMTDKELAILDKADPDTTGKQPDTIIEALELLGHLEKQKGALEARVQAKTSASAKIPDFIAQVSGSIGFIVIHVIIFAAWILLNTSGILSFDPFPFGFLTMAVSLEAIILASFILLSQNRQSQRDHYQEEIDFERDRLDLKVNTLDAKTIHETTIRIRNIEKQLSEISKKLDKKKR